MTGDTIHIASTRITLGTRLGHAKLGVVRVTHITPGLDGDARIEVQPVETAARDWFTLTHAGLRHAWGDTITHTTNPEPAPADDRTRNQPWADCGRLVDDTHDCIPRIDQTTDDERCKLCGQLLTQ